MIDILDDNNNTLNIIELLQKCLISIKVIDLYLLNYSRLEFSVNN